MSETTVLEIEHVSVDFEVDGKDYAAVDDISLCIREGEMTALVGESGCGKTQTAFSVAGLQPKHAKVHGEYIRILGDDMLKADQKEWEKIRGSEVSMIFQEPMTALNPLMKVGKQIAENGRRHGLSKDEAKTRALEMMNLVGLPDTDRLYECYPHQLSGGMRQRIMIAMALMNHPHLLVADEPTTALDVTIQAQIMELLKDMNRKTGTAVLLITHDLGVVKNTCDRIYVMYAGRIVESGDCVSLFHNPKHPYTKALLSSIPDASKKGEQLHSIRGMVPPLEQRNSVGCGYAERCEYCMERCRKSKPDEVKTKTGMVACHLYENEEMYE